MAPITLIIFPKAVPTEEPAESEPVEVETAAEQSIVLKLPGELRNRIYELVLFHESGDGVISPITQVAKIRGNCTVLNAGTRFHRGHQADLKTKISQASTDQEKQVIRELHNRLLEAASTYESVRSDSS